MPTLAIGTSTDAQHPRAVMQRGNARARGFTLIEILVVAMIIGVISVAAVLALSAGGRDRELEQQGRRLAALLELASEEAVMQGRELALEAFRDSYRFHAFEPDADEWQMLADDIHLGHRTLPEGLSLVLELEGRPANLLATPADSPRPQVMLLSSGEFTPFRLEIQRDRRAGLVLEADALGRVSLSLPDAAP